MAGRLVTPGRWFLMESGWGVRDAWVARSDWEGRKVREFGRGQLAEA